MSVWIGIRMFSFCDVDIFTLTHLEAQILYPTSAPTFLTKSSHFGRKLIGLQMSEQGILPYNLLTGRSGVDILWEVFYISQKQER